MQGKAPKKQGKTVSPRSGADVTGYQFKPGVSGNPRGAKKLTEEEKKTREQLRLLTVKTAHALEKVIKDQGGEASEELAQLVWKAAKGGNFAPLLSLWKELQDRTLGKPKERVDMSVSRADPVPIDLTDAQKEKLLKIENAGTDNST